MDFILSNRLYIPKKTVLKSHLSEFEYLIDPQTNLPDLSDDAVLYKNYKTFYDSQWDYGVCRGDLGKIYRVFNDFNIIDERSVQPHDFPLKFTGHLTEEQSVTADEWLDYGYGLIKAPPRWGKSVVITWMITKLKQRTLVLAHTIDLLAQLKEEFFANTNIKTLEASSQTPLVGIMNDLEIYPLVTFSTWQAFLSPRGRDFLKANRDTWGLTVVDECHRVGAECYSKIVNKINSYYRMGVTATPVRSKDQLHVVVNDSLGPVVAEGVTEQMGLDITYIPTSHIIAPFSRWTTMENKLVKDNTRNQLIARKVADDVFNGHTCLVITPRVGHCWTLANLINSESTADREIVVETITGKTWDERRKDIRHRMKRKEVDVLVATPQIIQLGFNVPPLSSLHNVMPTTNPENWYQRISRVRTVYRVCPKCGVEAKPTEKVCPKDGVVFILGKKRPVVRIYLDKPTTDSRGSTFGVITSYRKIVESSATELGFPVQFEREEKVAKPRTMSKAKSLADIVSNIDSEKF